MGIEYEKTVVKEKCFKCGRNLSNEESVTCSACGTARVSTAVLKAELDERAHLLIDRVP